MAKKLVGVRLEEELLNLKPDDVSFSDWLRECIHTWKLTKSGDIKKLLEGLEELSRKVEKVKECPDLGEIEAVIQNLEKVVSTLNDFVFKLRSSLFVLENLSNLVSEIKGFREKVEKTLIYSKPAYERSLEWEDEEF